MNKELLREYRTFIPKPITLIESQNNRGGNIFVEGIMATVEVKNGNGRYYSRELWERELNKFNQKIEQKSTETCGELDHPDSQIVNLQNTSHAIRKTWWDGDNIMCNIEIFCDMGEFGSPAGRIAGALVKNGLNIGISTRGMGSLEKKGELLEVQDDFDFLTADFVSNPSNPGSWFKQGNQLNEGISTNLLDPYSKVNNIINEILCSKGRCPIM
jgi:hypothetical protein